MVEKVCGQCGTELIDGVCPKCLSEENTVTSRVDEKFKDFFMSPNEKFVAVLGNSYLENFFHNGSINKGFAVVSDKRLYFQGTQYSLDEDGEIVEFSNSRIVDVRDVIGTGFDNFVDRFLLYKGILWCVVAVLCLAALPAISSIAIMMALYKFYRYYKSKISLIMIQYAGGEIGFDLKWFGSQEVELFQKQLRLAKDKSIEKERNAIYGEVQTKRESNVVDELSKLADLLSKGLITQEEFDKMKKELI